MFGNADFMQQQQQQNMQQGQINVFPGVQGQQMQGVPKMHGNMPGNLSGNSPSQWPGMGPPGVMDMAHANPLAHLNNVAGQNVAHMQMQGVPNMAGGANGIGMPPMGMPMGMPGMGGGGGHGGNQQWMQSQDGMQSPAMAMANQMQMQGMGQGQMQQGGDMADMNGFNHQAGPPKGYKTVSISISLVYLYVAISILPSHVCTCAVSLCLCRVAPRRVAAEGAF